MTTTKRSTQANSRSSRIAEERATLPDEARGYFDTLMRAPADVRLSVATREIVAECNGQCLCGWIAVDGSMHAGKSLPADRDGDVDVETDEVCQALYPTEGSPGGLFHGWSYVYARIIYHSERPFIESAFACAVSLAAEGV